MAEITLKDFKGINLKEGLWDQGFAAYARSVDFYGLGDDQTNVSYGGVLQRAMSLSTMAQSSASNAAIVSCITDFAQFNLASDGHVYGIDAGGANLNSRVYRWQNNVPEWWWVSSIATSGIGSHMAVYNNQLYYTTNNYLGYYDGTASYANYIQFSQANILPRPMKVFAGYLFVANGRYIDRYDGTTYLGQKLALPIDFTIRSIEIFRDGMYISADNGQFSRIFIWDGSSPTYNDSINLLNEQYAPTLQATQGILWAVGNRRGSPPNSQPTTFLTPIYIFQQGQPDLLFELPIRRDATWSPNSGVAAYQNGLLVASSEGSSATYEGGVGGVWFIGKEISTGLFHASLLFGVNPAAGSNVVLGGIFSSGATQAGTVGPALYIATSAANSNFTMLQAASPSVSDGSGGNNASYITLPIDAASTKNKVWTGMRINFEPLTSGQEVDIYYRLDSVAATWTLLKQFTYSTSQSTTNPYADRFMFIPIGKTGRTISIRILIAVGSSTATPRIHSMTLYYDELDN